MSGVHLLRRVADARRLLWLLSALVAAAPAFAPRAAAARPATPEAEADAGRPSSPVTLAQDAATVASELTTPGGRRSYLQGALTKVRPASLLRLDAPPTPEQPELRSALGQRRDQLLASHYARLAELDALADEASRGHDLRLAEQVEAARRRDTQQFFLAMQALKVQVLAAWSAGGP